MVNEGSLSRRIRVRASQLGARLFRNNTGRVQGKDDRWHVFGLTVGGSDLIGYVPVRITASMVGQRIAVFCAVEVKAGKTATTEDQVNFIRAIRAAGGLSGVARSVEEAEAILTP